MEQMVTKMEQGKKIITQSDEEQYEMWYPWQQNEGEFKLGLTRYVMNILPAKSW